MLELLWIADADEARSEPACTTRLWERCHPQDPATCPFGLCLRPAAGADPAPPFRAWPYPPRYLANPLVIDIAV
jgi:hypothetical protein